MNEDEARYCFIEILLGIQYLHSKNIIYRDIKPENIMIDMDGNLKIADFGLSKEGMRANDLANTYCGSPEYMAPEMLAKYLKFNIDQVILIQSIIIVLVLFSMSLSQETPPFIPGMLKKFIMQFKIKKYNFQLM